MMPCVVSGMSDVVQRRRQADVRRKSHERPFPIHQVERVCAECKHPPLRQQQQADNSRCNDGKDGDQRVQDEVVVAEQQTCKPCRDPRGRAGRDLDNLAVEHGETDERCRKEKGEGLDRLRERVLEGGEDSWIAYAGERG